MKVYIVEDDIFHFEDIQISLEELGYTCVGHSDDPFEALEQIGKLMPDAVILDIHLHGKEAGIALGDRVKRQYEIPVFFTTSSLDKEVMVKAAHINPVAYLTKPVNKNDLHAALVLAEQKKPAPKEAEPEESDTIFVKSGNKLIRVELSNIVYAHTDTKNYCTIVTTDNKKLSVRYSILKLGKVLGETDFVQTHRSHIVNWNLVDSFHEYEQTLEVKGHHVPVGRAFKENIQKRLRII